jgi:SAM-dependent methyltransferase
LQELEGRGFTLKDALPSNIVFDFVSPVFVDFLSIVRSETLEKEEWLVEVARKNRCDLRGAVLRAMYYPYFLVPLLEMGRRQFCTARTQLARQACNAGNGAPRLGRTSPYQHLLGLLKTLLGIGNNWTPEISIRLHSRRTFGARGGDDFNWRISRLCELVRDLDVSPPTSAYTRYYELKNENFDVVDKSSWKPKQRAVYQVLEETLPRRVLDIGANTGWYSALAERQGAEVIALDVDESSIESLYRRSRRQGLRILSLNIPFAELETQVFGRPDADERAGRDYTHNPLFMKATERLKADVVLCLGLLHHLVLGEGQSLDRVFTILDQLTLRTLLLEFVGLGDPLVRGEPSFFPCIERYSESTYSLGAVISAGLKRFKTHRVLDSDPIGRRLVVFER